MHDWLDNQVGRDGVHRTVWVHHDDTGLGTDLYDNQIIFTDQSAIAMLFKLTWG